MSALPVYPRRDPTYDTVRTQDQSYDRVRSILAAVADTVLEECPELVGLEDSRPERDRPSGSSWHGMETTVHVSALLASQSGCDPDPERRRRLLAAIDGTVTQLDLHRCSCSHPSTVLWRDEAGARLEVVFGVRLLVRAYSAPFLPGSLHPPQTTSPVSALSPITPPARSLN